MSDTAAFEATWHGLGLPDDVDIALDATITPRTFALRSEGLAARAEPRLEALPRITVRYPSAGEPSEEAPSPSAAEDTELSLTAILGEGGMGRVYLARQRSLDRDVAVKAAKASAGSDASIALCNEAVITGRLEHPSLIPVHALARDAAGQPLMIMKRVDGTSLGDLLANRDHPFWARLSVAKEDHLAFCLESLTQVCHAISFAHSRGFLHRDLKPENIMIGDFGAVYVVDWGIATRLGPRPASDVLVGTPAYMAPEMVERGALDERTDVFLLGGILHEILTGEPPHSGESLRDVLSAAHASAPKAFDSEVPEELAMLCTSALSRDSSGRPATAQAFRQKIADYQRHLGSRAISRTADERLASLREAMGRPARERDPMRLRRLVTECRFGYQEAARTWPRNPAVSPGMRETLLLAAEIEIERRDLEAARALFAEVDDAPHTLVARLDRLSEELSREEEEKARLLSIAEQLNPNVESRLRGGVAALGIVAALGVTVLALSRRGGMSHVEVSDLLLYAGILAVVYAGSIGAFHRRLLSNQFNRRLISWIGVALAVVILDRVTALTMRTADVPRIFVSESAMLFGMFSVGAVFVNRAFWLGGAIYLAATLSGGLFPEIAAPLFATSAPLAILVSIVAWRRAPHGEAEKKI